jgi:hypothetical protein
MTSDPFKVSVALLFVITTTTSAIKAEAIKAAEGGKAMVPIVVKSDAASQAEHTAAKELADYLKKISGAEFAVVEEKDFKGNSAIYVGWTEFAKNHGIDAASLGIEESVLKTVDGSLILTGGRPRGTLYAVYELLEKHLGVRWYTPTVENVPSQQTLMLPPLDRRVKPYFNWRNNNSIHGTFGYVPEKVKLQAGSWWKVTDEGFKSAPEGVKPLGMLDATMFMARNRLNVGLSYSNEEGKRINNPPVVGGEVYAAWPTNHSFQYYISDDKYFKDHPEYFSLYHGKRVKQSQENGLRQLCLSNPELPAVFAKEVIAHIKKHPDTYYVSITPNDGSRIFCECENCRKLAAEYGAPPDITSDGGAMCEAGLLLQFVNKVADIVSKDYPHMKFLTLSYNYTHDAPIGIEANDNVIVQLCGGVFSTRRRINPRVKMTPKDRERAEAWAKIAKHIWAWDYLCGSDFCNDNFKPMVWSMDRTFKEAHRLGVVDGMFMECEQNGPPLVPDLFDMNLWVAAHLYQDPAQDVETLIADFVKGFYGSAAPAVLEYMKLVRSGLEGYPLQMIDWVFSRKAQTLLDEAENQAKTDPSILGRLADLRINLDVTTLQFRHQIWADYLAKGGKKDDYPFTIPVLRARIEKNLKIVTNPRWYVSHLRGWKTSQIVNNYKTGKESWQKQMSEYLDVICAGEEIAGPLPKELAELPRERVIDLTWPMLLQNTLGSVTLDPDAAMGMTTVVFTDLPFFAQRGQMPFELGIYDSYQRKVISPADLPPRTGKLAQAYPGQLFQNEVVAGPNYNWYTVPDFPMGPYVRTFATKSWYKQINCSGLFDPANPEQKWKVYWSIRLRGPNYPFGSLFDPDMFCLDRVVLVRLEDGEKLSDTLTPAKPVR